MKRIKEFFVNSFFLYLAIELVEETLEELISWGISSLFIKGASTLLIVSVSHGTKLLIKRIVKTLTYKEGNDKVEKLKTAWNWFRANKCTILGIVTGAGVAVSGTVLDSNSLPALMIGTFNLTPILYWVFLGVLVIVSSFFPETYNKWKERVDIVKADKEQKALVKEAKKELANEEKLANQTQAQKEKEEAKKQADERAKLEKEQADSEHKAKVDAIKAQLIAEKQKTENAQNA